MFHAHTLAQLSTVHKNDTSHVVYVTQYPRAKYYLCMLNSVQSTCGMKLGSKHTGGNVSFSAALCAGYGLRNEWDFLTQLFFFSKHT